MSDKLIDDQLFAELSQHTISELPRLAPANAAAIEAALKAGVEPPEFVYQKVHELNIADRLQKLQVYEETSVAAATDDGLQTLYGKKCVSIRNVLHMLRAIQLGTDREFHHYSSAETGPMDWFGQKATQIRLNQLITETAGDARSLVQTARSRLLDQVEEPRSTETVLEFMLSCGIVLPAYVDVSHEQRLAATDVCDYFTSYLKDHGVTGYSVKIDQSGVERNLKVQKKSKTVIIPNDDRLQVGRRRLITATTVRAFAEHELGVHVMRGFNGYQRLNLLGYGLAGYLNFEECMASYRQALVEGIDDVQKFEHRLATMAIEGNLTGVPLAMAEAYMIVIDALTLRAALDDKQGNIDLNRVHDLTWTPLLRVCRGTTGKTPGTCYTKDSRVYSNGFPEIYHWLQLETQRSEKAMLGKYDPRKPEHVRPLELLGVL